MDEAVKKTQKKGFLFNPKINLVKLYRKEVKVTELLKQNCLSDQPTKH